MTPLQTLFLALHNNAPAMVDAVKAGVFYSPATYISSSQYALPLTNLSDGQVFPVLFATEAESEADIQNEIQDRRDAIEKGDMESNLDDDDDGDDDDFDLATVEVGWDGGENFTINGRPVTLAEIVQGSC